MAALVEATERLYKTEDGEIVPAGHPDARWLYAIPGQLVPAGDAPKKKKGTAK